MIAAMKSVDLFFPFHRGISECHFAGKILKNSATQFRILLASFMTRYFHLRIQSQSHLIRFVGLRLLDDLY